MQSELIVHCSASSSNLGIAQCKDIMFSALEVRRYMNQRSSFLSLKSWNIVFVRGADISVSLPLPVNAFTSLAGVMQHLCVCMLILPHEGSHGDPIHSWNLTYCWASSEADRFASPLNPKPGTNIPEIFLHTTSKLTYNLANLFNRYFEFPPINLDNFVAYVDSRIF